MLRKKEWKLLGERGLMMSEWMIWMRRDGWEKEVGEIYKKWLETVKKVVEVEEGEGGSDRGEGMLRVWGKDLECLRKKKIRARREWVSKGKGQEKGEAKRKWRVLVREMKRLVRRKKMQDKLDRMRRIENLGSKNPKKMWDQWRKWEKKEEEEQRGRKDMVDGDGKVVSEKEIAQKWAEVFKKVVVEMKGEYNDKWKREVEED